LILDNVSMAFDEKKLFSDANLTIRKGNRMFLLGPNGCGKTTLFKLITGVYEPISGTVRLGSNIAVGWYDQTQSDLSLDKTVFEEIADAHPHLTQTEVRNALAAFLFRGDDVFAPISELSGGERARVSLVKLMLSDVNFLLLDEPTNHLDIASREALEQALLEYDGTLFIVSHDRYFINRLAHSVCHMDTSGLTLYHGDYDYFQEKYTEAAKPKVQEAPAAGKESYLQQKQAAAEARKRENDLKKVEKEIADCEQKAEELQEALNNVGSDFMKAQELSESLEALNEKLLELYEKWEELSS
ncbi:MAG: ATP-binding cassette domain-containing protein, partial [Clostridia bacterium]|nr:ATP-binding cassette domain-containing protein [Clostridia bacterium]